jgi:hypothetical protein
MLKAGFSPILQTTSLKYVDVASLANNLAILQNTPEAFEIATSI